MLPAYPVSRNKSRMASKMVGTNQTKAVSYNNFDICLRKKIVDGKPTLCGTLNGYSNSLVGGVAEQLPIEYTDMETFKKAVYETLDSKIKEME